jgi:hypothetical protein
MEQCFKKQSLFLKIIELGTRTWQYKSKYNAGKRKERMMHITESFTVDTEKMEQEETGIKRENS